MDHFEQVLNTAIENRAKGARIIPVYGIALNERVILKCQVPICNEYGNHLPCPSNSPSLEQFQEVLKKYSHAQNDLSIAG